MPLSADQRAMLQLLLERGQGYPELAALLAVEEAEVRDRARQALQALAGADPDRRAPLTDYLLGQSDPIDRADAVRHLRDDPEDHGLARELVAMLRELYPEADLPRLPGEPRQGRFARRRATSTAASEAPSAEPKRPGTGLSQRQTRLVIVLGSAAVLLIAVILGVTGAFGGDDEEAPASAETTDAESTTADETGDELAVIDLRPTSGGDARGQVVIGVGTAGQPYADLTVEGLEPATGDNAFVLWLMLNRKTGYPVSAVGVPASGQLNDRYAIPSSVAAVAARTKFVDISLTSRRGLRREILEAAEAVNPVIPYTGESVLRGAVSRAPAPAGG